MPKYPSGFYVYRLVDPANSLPFYVGKGQKRRAWQHQAVVAKGGSSRNERKDKKIRGIIARGQDVEVEIVACYASEADALDHEFRLVDADPTLTNAVPGGAGNPIVAEKRRKKLKVLRHRKLVEAVGRAEAKLRCSPVAPSWLPRIVSGDYDGETFERAKRCVEKLEKIKSGECRPKPKLRGRTRRGKRKRANLDMPRQIYAVMRLRGAT